MLHVWFVVCVCALSSSASLHLIVLRRPAGGNGWQSGDDAT
jgi:hypothetical protein